MDKSTKTLVEKIIKQTAVDFECKTSALTLSSDDSWIFRPYKDISKTDFELVSGFTKNLNSEFGASSRTNLLEARLFKVPRLMEEDPVPNTVPAIQIIDLSA